MKPREYQTDAVDAAWDTCMRGKNPLIVVPTGGGKSVIIAELIKRVMDFGGRVVVLAHRKELLQQNADKIEKMVGVEVGVYSAGLNSKDVKSDVVVAGIQSVYKHANKLDRRHFVIIDEAHLIPSDRSTMYGQFLGDMAKYNPKLFVVGLTATPYRTGEGDITEGELFDETAYNCSLSGLIEKGYLSELITRPGSVQADSGSMRIVRGEFKSSDMEKEFDKITEEACREIVELTHERDSTIVFCSSVAHAEKAASFIEEFSGWRAAIVTGETTALDRGENISRFKSGDIRYLVNVNVLTTGFDAPNVDCVVGLRSTVSAGLWAQIVGRGLRISPGKKDCLILDYGENIKRHGALDSPDYGKTKKKGEGSGEAPKRQCTHCEGYSPAGNAFCADCGVPFPDPEAKAVHQSRSDLGGAILSRNAAEKRWYDVSRVNYAFNRGKENKKDTLRVEYYCFADNDKEGDLKDTFKIKQWICIEHDGFAGNNAAKWWANVSSTILPCDVGEAIEERDAGNCRDPISIEVSRDGNFWRVHDYKFEVEIPEPSDKNTYSDDDIPF